MSRRGPHSAQLPLPAIQHFISLKTTFLNLTHSFTLYQRAAGPTCSTGTRKYTKTNHTNVDFVTSAMQRTSMQTCTLTQAKEGVDPLRHRRRLQSALHGHFHGGKINLHVVHRKKRDKPRFCGRWRRMGANEQGPKSALLAFLPINSY